MIMAADLSHLMGWISSEDLARVKQIIQNANLPIACPTIPLNEFLAYMSHDKKVLDGKIRLILMKQLGQAVITDDFDVDEMKQAILNNQNKGQ